MSRTTLRRALLALATSAVLGGILAAPATTHNGTETVTSVATGEMTHN
jgi:redox-sensitive bicupin YhaK (pirin superfamily)